jgi:predicted HicB family RNase H-like nuclease
MEHIGFAARVVYSEEDSCVSGHIAGIRKVIGFHGASIAELRSAFEEAVADYLVCHRVF